MSQKLTLSSVSSHGPPAPSQITPLHYSMHTRAHTHPRTHAHKLRHACKPMNTHTQTQAHTHKLKHACKPMHTHTHKPRHTHTNSSMHANPCTRTHTHTNPGTHAHMQTPCILYDNRCPPMELTISGCSFTTTEMSQITPYSHHPPPPSYPNTHIIFLTAVHSLMPTPPHPDFITVWVSQMLIPSRCLGLGCVTIPWHQQEQGYIKMLLLLMMWGLMSLDVRLTY